MNPRSSKFATYEPGRPSKPLEFLVRRAGPNDTSAIAEIAFERDGGILEEHRHGAAAEIELQGMDKPTRLVLVAVTNGVIAGFGRARYSLTPEGESSEEFPEGWYLSGVSVAPRFRRHGVGLRLTEERILWVAERATVVRYFASLQNRASIALHEKLGFKEVRRATFHPHFQFAGGIGALYELPLDGRTGERHSFK